MKKIALLSLVLAAGAAFAAEPGNFDPHYAAGTATRASVQAELQQAVKADALPATGEVGDYAVDSQGGRSLDRSAVRAEGRLASRSYQTVGEV